jgi:hypothetical protein
MSEHLQQIVFKLDAQKFKDFVERQKFEGDIYFSFGVDKNQKMGLNIILGEPQSSSEVIPVCPYPPGCDEEG